MSDRRVGRPFKLLEQDFNQLIMNASFALEIEIEKNTPDYEIIGRLLDQLDKLQGDKQIEDDRKSAEALEQAEREQIETVVRHLAALQLEDERIARAVQNEENISVSKHLAASQLEDERIARAVQNEENISVSEPLSPTSEFVLSRRGRH